MDTERLFTRPRSLLVAIGLFIAIRFVTLGVPEISDPSEARYANAARHMVESGEWLVPKIINLHHGWEPYLAKPPLHIWLTAISFKVFGASPWALRFVPALAMGITAFFIFLLSRALAPGRALHAVLIYLSLPTVFFLCTASTTDPLLMACVTGGVTSFALQRERRFWGYLHFLFLALGFLTKGPIAVVLISGPIFLWVWYEKKWSLLKMLPWVRGAILFLVIALPWYIACELEQPGFLHYFFIQENIGRYLYRDFGIKYGSGHRRPYGTSIAYFLLVGLPWSLAFFTLMAKRGRDSVQRFFNEDPWHRFLVIVMIFPALFFIASRQILPTYFYATLPAMSIIVVLFLKQSVLERYMRRVIGIFSITYLVILTLCTSAISRQISYAPWIDQLRDLKCKRFVIFEKVPQSMYLYGRDVLGDFVEGTELEQELRKEDQCILVQRKDVLLHTSINAYKMLSEYRDLVVISGAH